MSQHRLVHILLIAVKTEVEEPVQAGSNAQVEPNIGQPGHQFTAVLRLWSVCDNLTYGSSHTITEIARRSRRRTRPTTLYLYNFFTTFHTVRSIVR